MKQTKIGILGAGNIAAKMAETLQNLPTAQLWAVAARDTVRAKNFAERYGAKKAYGSYEELAADSEIDLVYIATPNNCHLAHAMLCLQNNKHVLCEKPFTVNKSEAKELFSFAKQQKRLITEALWTRYMPMTRQLCSLLQEGAIGEPHVLQASMSALAPLPRLKDPDLAGGALLDIGVYLLTLDALVFGTEVENISSSVIKSADNIDIQNCITLIHPGQKQSVLSCTMLSVSDRRATILGSDGYLVIDNVNNIEQIEVFNKDRQSVAVYQRPPQTTGFEYEVLACIRAIENGELECPEMPHSETLRILGLMDTLRKEWCIAYPCER